MKQIRQWVVFGLSVLMLSGCAMMGTKSNLPTPLPLVKFSPTLTVQKLWSTDVGAGAGKYYLRLNPVVAGASIYVPEYRGNVLAMNTETGTLLWRQHLYSSLTSGISAASGKLFVGSGDGEVYALSQKDGHKLWNTAVGTEVLATPTAAKGMVLVKAVDGSITALSQQDGRQLWRVSQTVPSLILNASSQPQVAGNLAVVGYANGKLSAINIYTGRVIWTRQIALPGGATSVERMVDIDVSPVVVKGVVYAATYQGELAALDLNTGQLVWRHHVSAYAGLAADYQHLYVSDAKSRVWAFGNDAGAVLWLQKALKYRVLSGPALLGKTVVVGDGQGYVHWMSKDDGHFLARVQTSDSAILATPVVAHKTVFVYAQNGRLAAYRVSPIALRAVKTKATTTALKAKANTKTKTKVKPKANVQTKPAATTAALSQ